MKARTALKNFNDYMIRTYGANYVHHWTEDDRATYEILAARVREEMTPKPVERTSYMRVFMTGKREPEHRTAEERRAAWSALVAKAGTGIKGTLSAPNTYGTKPKTRKGKKIVTEAAPENLAGMVEQKRETLIDPTKTSAADFLASLRAANGLAPKFSN